jgi:hypothetical protein
MTAVIVRPRNQSDNPGSDNPTVFEFLDLALRRRADLRHDIGLPSVADHAPGFLVRGVAVEVAFVKANSENQENALHAQQELKTGAFMLWSTAFNLYSPTASLEYSA